MSSPGSVLSTPAVSGSMRLARAIRRHAVEMAHRGGASHVGSVLSCADALAVLYGGVLRVSSLDPGGENRDRFIMSKGHAGAGVYAALAERGFISRDWLNTYYADGSLLCGHVSHRGIPGVEVSTGSLGHGLSIGAGMAYAGKLKAASWRVFVLLSDGECDEGSVWEAAMFGAHHRLDNLVAIIDYNKLQSLKPVSATLGLEPFADKWAAFGWGVRRLNGHDHVALHYALGGVPAQQGRPTCLILDTVKGKGVSFMENSVLWHYRSPQGEEYLAAMRELGEES